MKINWKLRLRNKAVLAAIIAAIVGGVYGVCTPLGIELPKSQESIMAIAAAALSLLQLLGIIVDPTTKGIADSDRAMNYDEPR
jgi:phi LC3 family holin